MPEPTDVQPPSDVEGSVSADQNIRARRPREVWLGKATPKHALNLALVAFTGYVLATLVHRRSASPKPAAPAAARPAPASRPRTAYRDPPVGRDERSSIRYR